MLRGYALQSRRSAASSQETTLAAAGVTDIYVEGRDGQSQFDAVLKSLRKGDHIAVVRLADLAASRRQLRKRMEAVHAKGCFVFEQATKRDSRKKPDLAGMIFDATETLTHSGKGHDPEKAREFGARGGRPRKARGMNEADAEKHWFDLRYETNAEAVKHMPGWDAQVAWRRFGASGRKTGPRRVIAKRNSKR
jgi:hypothetical protein